MNNQGIRRILLIIPLLCIAVSIGCSSEEPVETATQTPGPSVTLSAEPTVIEFTPEPEPSILVNMSRGETVVRMQRRLKDLGYYHYRPTGYFLDVTKNSLMAFQQENDSLQSDGTAGKESLDMLFNNPYPNRKKTSGIPDAEPPEEKTPSQYGNLLVWESVSQLLQQNTEFDVWDLNTGITLHMVRTGGNNHMHAEPLTLEDTDALSAMFSKVVTGDKRPILIKFEGQTIAASIYGAAHGEDSVPDNGYDGHACIYFSGCTDETYNMPDAEHNQNIDDATTGNKSNTTPANTGAATQPPGTPANTDD